MPRKNKAAKPKAGTAESNMGMGMPMLVSGFREPLDFYLLRLITMAYCFPEAFGSLALHEAKRSLLGMLRMYDGTRDVAICTGPLTRWGRLVIPTDGNPATLARFVVPRATSEYANEALASVRPELWTLLQKADTYLTKYFQLPTAAMERASTMQMQARVASSYLFLTPVTASRAHADGLEHFDWNAYYVVGQEHLSPNNMSSESPAVSDDLVLELHARLVVHRDNVNYDCMHANKPLARLYDGLYDDVMSRIAKVGVQQRDYEDRLEDMVKLIQKAYQLVVGDVFEERIRTGATRALRGVGVFDHLQDGRYDPPLNVAGEAKLLQRLRVLAGTGFRLNLTYANAALAVQEPPSLHVRMARGQVPSLDARISAADFYVAEYFAHRMRDLYKQGYNSKKEDIVRQRPGIIRWLRDSFGDDEWEKLPYPGKEALSDAELPDAGGAAAVAAAGGGGGSSAAAAAAASAAPPLSSGPRTSTRPAAKKALTELAATAAAADDEDGDDDSDSDDDDDARMSAAPDTATSGNDDDDAAAAVANAQQERHAVKRGRPRGSTSKKPAVSARQPGRRPGRPPGSKNKRKPSPTGHAPKRGRGRGRKNHAVERGTHLSDLDDMDIGDGGAVHDDDDDKLLSPIDIDVLTPSEFLAVLDMPSKNPMDEPSTGSVVLGEGAGAASGAFVTPPPPLAVAVAPLLPSVLGTSLDPATNNSLALLEALRRMYCGVGSSVPTGCALAFYGIIPLATGVHKLDYDEIAARWIGDSGAKADFLLAGLGNMTLHNALKHFVLPCLFGVLDWPAYAAGQQQRSLLQAMADYASPDFPPSSFRALVHMLVQQPDDGTGATTPEDTYGVIKQLKRIILIGLAQHDNNVILWYQHAIHIPVNDILSKGDNFRQENDHEPEHSALGELFGAMANTPWYSVNVDPRQPSTGWSAEASYWIVRHYRPLRILFAYVVSKRDRDVGSALRLLVLNALAFYLVYYHSRALLYGGLPVVLDCDRARASYAAADYWCAVATQGPSSYFVPLVPLAQSSLPPPPPPPHTETPEDALRGALSLADGDDDDDVPLTMSQEFEPQQRLPTLSHTDVTPARPFTPPPPPPQRHEQLRPDSTASAAAAAAASSSSVHDSASGSPFVLNASPYGIPRVHGRAQQLSTDVLLRDTDLLCDALIEQTNVFDELASARPTSQHGDGVINGVLARMPSLTALWQQHRAY